MKKLMPVLIVLAIAGIWKHVTETPANTEREDLAGSSDASGSEPKYAVERQDFRCDGRVYCSEMTSCAEARYFLEHCPGVKMDGEGDGIPCEGQWCGHL
jgi:hypothetical protein